MNQRTFLTGLFVATIALVPIACGSDDDNTSADSIATPASSDSLPPESALPTDIPTIDTAEPLVVGKSEADAEAAVAAFGWVLRVVQRDGEDLPVTADLRQDRVNVAVEAGVVTEVVNIG